MSNMHLFVKRFTKEKSFWILHLIFLINCLSCYQYTSKFYFYLFFPWGENGEICRDVLLNGSNFRMTGGGRSLTIGLDVRCMISLLAVKH